MAHALFDHQVLETLMIEIIWIKLICNKANWMFSAVFHMNIAVSYFTEMCQVVLRWGTAFPFYINFVQVLHQDYFFILELLSCSSVQFHRSHLVCQILAHSSVLSACHRVSQKLVYNSFLAHVRSSHIAYGYVCEQDGQLINVQTTLCLDASDSEQSDKVAAASCSRSAWQLWRWSNSTEWAVRATLNFFSLKVFIITLMSHFMHTIPVLPHVQVKSWLDYWCHWFHFPVCPRDCQDNNFRQVVATSKYVYVHYSCLWELKLSQQQVWTYFRGASSLHNMVAVNTSDISDSFCETVWCNISKDL